MTARDVKFDEILLGFDNFRNKVEPLYISDDDEEKNDVEAPIEDVKEPTSEKLAFKIAKEVQPVLRRSLPLKAKEDAQKEDEEKKDSKEDDLILCDIETYSDSESPEESGESSQGILKPRQTLLSLPQVWFLRRWSMESLMRLNLLFSGCHVRTGIKGMD